MQVFGLPRHVIRAGCVSSRIAAKPPSGVAAIRRATLERWRVLRSHGLTAQQAAAGVGHSPAALYRWAQDAEPKSRRPHRTRPKTWRPELVAAVERIRDDNPMWGKEKIVVLLAREGIATSASTVGRILRHLMDRGVVTPVPTLRRRPGGRRFRLTGPERHARRLPKGLKPTRPGEIVQVDTLFVNVAPNRAVKHFTAYDPVAKWTVGLVAGRATAAGATALLEKLVAEAPFPVKGIQVDGGSEFRAAFEQACQNKSSTSSSCRPSGRSSTAASREPKAHGVTSSTPASTCRAGSTSSSLSSTPSPTASTTTDPTRPLADKPQPSTSKPSASLSLRRLTCAELGHRVDLAARHVLHAGGKPDEKPALLAAHGNVT